MLLSVKNSGVGEILLNGESRLSMKKVISRESLNPKNQLLHKSKFFSFNDPINTNHRQMSVTGTDHFNSKSYNLRNYNHSVF